MSFDTAATSHEFRADSTNHGAGMKGAAFSTNPDEASTAAKRGAQRVLGVENAGAFKPFALAVLEAPAAKIAGGTTL